MIIADLNGYPIEVTDLKEALKMASQYKEYSHEEKSFSELDTRLKAYWTDMFEKLTAVKKRLDKD